MLTQGRKLNERSTVRIATIFIFKEIVHEVWEIEQVIAALMKFKSYRHFNSSRVSNFGRRIIHSTKASSKNIRFSYAEDLFFSI